MSRHFCKATFCALATVALFASFRPAWAASFAEVFPDVKFKTAAVQALAESFDYKRGKIALGVGGVELDVPNSFYFLSQDDARRVLVDLWDNPPIVADGILGMILPADKAPVEETWGAIVTFADDGYVSDANAKRIDYDALMKSMKKAVAAVSGERVANGFGPMRLMGWASAPYYDAASHKAHWAKELHFNDAPKNTLNYDVRALGRYGVLKFNFVAAIDQLPAIKGIIPEVLAMPNFTVGARYEDFVRGADRVAAYGIDGLIAGSAIGPQGFLARIMERLGDLWFYFLAAVSALIGMTCRSTACGALPGA